MLLAPLVVGVAGAAERLDQGLVIHPPHAVGIRLGGLDRRFQGGQGHAGVAGRGPGEMVEVLGRDLRTERGQPALGVGQGPAEDRRDVLLGQGIERQDAGPRQERGVDLERRVLGRRADQGDRPVLDGRQQGVLLGLVEPVDLVDEQDRALAPAALGLRPRRSPRGAP